MKKQILTAVVLVVCMSLSVAAAEQAVVDRSTRSKILNDYALLTRDAIQKAWTTPLDLAVPNALKGRVRINYTIDRKGNLKALELVRGSGIAAMDRSLLTAVRSAAPFPRFPDEIEAPSVLIRANFIVADLPAVPVTRVSQNVTNGKPTNTSVPDITKKFQWGVPAGSSDPKSNTPESDKAVTQGNDRIPPPFPSKKYPWGLRGKSNK
jgi:TonB family protein